MAVEVLAASVVDGGGAWVGVTGGELDVAQWDAGVECGHDERGAKHVWVNLAESGSFADRSHPAMRCSPIETLTVRRRRIGPSWRSPIARSIVRAVRGTSGMTAGLLPLPVMGTPSSQGKEQT